MKMIINFVKRHENAKLPIYSTTEAAGADIFSIDSYVVPPGGICLVKTGLGCSIPNGWELQVRPRSGLALKNQITVLNSPGTIDSDYTGELGVILVNHSDAIFKVAPGDRIAQIVLAPVYQGQFSWTDEARETDRTGGFGSTGV